MKEHESRELKLDEIYYYFNSYNKVKIKNRFYNFNKDLGFGNH